MRASYALLAATLLAYLCGTASAQSCSCTGCEDLTISAGGTREITNEYFCNGKSDVSVHVVATDSDEWSGISKFTVNVYSSAEYTKYKNGISARTISTSGDVSCLGPKAEKGEDSYTYVVITCSNLVWECMLEHDIRFSCIDDTSPSSGPTSGPTSPTNPPTSSTGRLGKGTTGNEVGVAIYSDSECRSISAYDVYTAGVCTYTEVFGTYFRVSESDSGMMATEFRCSDTCGDSCQSKQTANEGLCRPLHSTQFYSTSHRILQDRIEVSLYEDSLCTSRKEVITADANVCTRSSQTGGLFAVSALGDGYIAGALFCDASCNCGGLVVTAEGSCIKVGDVIYAKARSLGPPSAASASGASLALVALLAAAGLSARL